VTVVAVLNPLRMAVAVRGVPGRDVAIGAAVGGTALVAVGALSGAILDALDVSRPAMRLAAASLCALAAVVDLARPRPAIVDDIDDGGGAGPAWLVPVAVPAVVRPALVIAGWSVVADHSLPTYAGAIAVAVAAGVAATLVRLPDRLPRGVATWAMRLISAVGIAFAVLLVADAVFDI